jgi:hypothetical protein
MPDDHKFGAYLALEALSKDKGTTVQPKDKELVANLLNGGARKILWRGPNETRPLLCKIFLPKNDTQVVEKMQFSTNYTPFVATNH